jgi:hypothetical protein
MLTPDPVQPDALLALLMSQPGFDPDSLPAWLVAECRLSLKESGYMDEAGIIDSRAAQSELNRTRTEPLHSITKEPKNDLFTDPDRQDPATTKAHVSGSLHPAQQVRVRAGQGKARMR